MPALPPQMLSRGGDPGLVAQEYLWRIKEAISQAPRSRQMMIGPSAIGGDCSRRLGYQLLQHPRRTQPVNWRATVGTGVHLWLEQVFGGSKLDTVPLAAEGQERYAVETRLEIGQVGGQLILGTCDVYDRTTATVIDHKTCGKTRLDHYKRHGPPQVYKVQGHLYGLGWVRAGLPVDTVMISFLPRDGELDDSYVWWEPFNLQLALDALKRLEGIQTLIKTFGTDALGMLGTEDEWCISCPYWLFKSNDLVKGCPGDPGMRQPTVSTPTAGGVLL